MSNEMHPTHSPASSVVMWWGGGERAVTAREKASIEEHGGGSFSITLVPAAPPLGDRHARFGRGSVYLLKILGEYPHVPKDRMESLPAFLIVLQPQKRAFGNLEHLDGAENTRQSAPNAWLQDMQAPKHFLCLREMDCPEDFEKVSTLFLIQTKEDVLNLILVCHPSFGARRRVEKFRDQVDKQKAAFTLTGRFINLMSSARHTVCLKAKPENGDRGYCGYQDSYGCNKQCEEPEEQSPCIPVNGAIGTHWPTLIHPAPPLHAFPFPWAASIHAIQPNAGRNAEAGRAAQQLNITSWICSQPESAPMQRLTSGQGCFSDCSAASKLSKQRWGWSSHSWPWAELTRWCGQFREPILSVKFVGLCQISPTPLDELSGPTLATVAPPRDLRTLLPEGCDRG